MLIRFLSYLASIIGARRYKPLLISCLALVFSVASISVLISSASKSSSDAASTVKQEGTPSGGSQQSSSPGLSGFEQKTTKEPDTAAQDPQQNTTSSTPETKQQGTAQVSSFDIHLNTNMVSLSQSNPESAVTVTAVPAPEAGKLQWSVAAEGNLGISGRIESLKDSAGTAVVRFRADAFSPGTYQFTVTAKAASGTQSASKTISVTVN